MQRKSNLPSRRIDHNLIAPALPWGRTIPSQRGTHIMTHSDAMKAIRQAATTADLSEVIDVYLEALGEDPADSASETFEETAARFYDTGNTDAYNVIMAAYSRWRELEREEREQV
jgi:hypothetical protein